MKRKIFILGAGSMAEAFIRGVTMTQAVEPAAIAVKNRSNHQRAEELRQLYGVHIAGDLSEIVSADIVIIAVKPVDVEAALCAASPYLDNHILLSFAAGIPIEWLKTKTAHRVPVVRAMPNLPAAVLSGATAIARCPDVTQSQLNDIRFLLQQVGIVVELEESMMDAATAFSGSGPGFVSYFLEAMEQAAVALGFDAETARQLLLQTVVGTAKVLEEWKLSPGELRRRVTSQGGTTHAGLTVFEERRMQETVEAALQSAALRAKELGTLR